MDLISRFFQRREDRAPSAFIPFDSRSSIGGPTTFLNNLHGYMDRAGFPYETKLDRASVILFPISYDLRTLEKFKMRGGKICQRLDGVYYPEKHGNDYLRRNEKIKKIYLDLADHVIFQSEYSRLQCFDMFGEKEPSSYSIIVNGVNTDIFHPSNKQFDKTHVHFCTTGSIRNIDMLDPIIRALDSLEKHMEFSFHVVGPIRDEACAKLMDRKYVIHHGSCDLEKVAEILRASDIFIFSLLNPPCPNSVIEAIATGLPIVGFNSGAMPELLSFSPDLLADAGEKLYHSFSDLSADKLYEKLIKVIHDYPGYKNRSLEACKIYSMDNCGQRYIEVLKGLMTKAGKSI